MHAFIPIYWEGDGSHPSPFYNVRGSFYGLNGIPHVQFGGYISVVGGGGDMYPNYLGKYNMLEDDNSPLSISQTVNVAGGNIIMQAEVTVTDDITTSNNKILFLTSHYYNSEYFCTVGSYNEQAFGLTTDGINISKRSSSSRINLKSSIFKVVVKCCGCGYSCGYSSQV